MNHHHYSKLFRTLALAGEANAGPGHSHRRGRPYYARHGVKFNGGYFYRGHGHRHWKHRVWNGHYRRYHYYDPHLRCYYHYCPVRLGYFPVPVTPGCGFGHGNDYGTQYDYGR